MIISVSLFCHYFVTCKVLSKMSYNTSKSITLCSKKKSINFNRRYSSISQESIKSRIRRFYITIVRHIIINRTRHSWIYTFNKVNTIYIEKNAIICTIMSINQSMNIIKYFICSKYTLFSTKLIWITYTSKVTNVLCKSIKFIELKNSYKVKYKRINIVTFFYGGGTKNSLFFNSITKKFSIQRNIT